MFINTSQCMPIIDSNDKKSIKLQKKNYEIVLHPMHGAPPPHPTPPPLTVSLTVKRPFFLLLTTSLREWFRKRKKRKKCCLVPNWGGGLGG